MKSKTVKLLVGLACLGTLASCGAPATSSTPTPASTGAAETSSDASLEPIFSDTYTDIDSINVESGDYMVGDTVYAFDKANKKINVAKYEDYDAYKDKKGTVLYDGSVRFVKVTSTFLGTMDAVYFEIDKAVNLLYLDASSKVCLSRVSGSTWSSSGAVALKDVPLFVMGKYVSDKQSQNKADEQGSYEYDSNGNTIREEFYLFLELSETKASVFLSDNPNTYGDTPLHSVENYKTRIVSGKLHISIPHKDGEFALTLTSYSETEIKFVNAMERKGDYSCSGTFTKVVK